MNEYIVNAQHKVINDIRYDKGNNYLNGVTSLKVVYPTAFLFKTLISTGFIYSIEVRIDCSYHVFSIP